MLLLSLLSLSSSSQNKSFPFIPNEIVSYEINYNWGFIWVSAGEVSFSVKSSEVYGKPALTLTGEGKTFPKYDFCLGSTEKLMFANLLLSKIFIWKPTF